jgi:hypothetical protein
VGTDTPGRSRWPLLLPFSFLAAVLHRNSMKNGSLVIPTRDGSQPGGIDNSSQKHDPEIQRRLLRSTTSLLTSPRDSNNCFPSAVQLKSKIRPAVNFVIW